MEQFLDSLSDIEKKIFKSISERITDTVSANDMEEKKQLEAQAESFRIDILTAVLTPDELQQYRTDRASYSEDVMQRFLEEGLTKVYPMMYFSMAVAIYGPACVSTSALYMHTIQVKLTCIFP
jgi:hypothetical protein